MMFDPTTKNIPLGITATPTAHLYSRVSAIHQLLGDGLKRQLDGTTKYAADHHLTIKQTYTDRGVSAYRGKNSKKGQLAVILESIEKRIILPGEHLIIESVDRLSRED